MALLQLEPLFPFVSDADVPRAKSHEQQLKDHLYITCTALVDLPNGKLMQDCVMLLDCVCSKLPDSTPHATLLG